MTPERVTQVATEEATVFMGSEWKTLPCHVRAFEAAIRRVLTEAAPKWTKEPPTVPGPWWWRRGLFKARIVDVCVWPAGGLTTRIPELSSHSDGIVKVEDVGGEWAGPLIPPEATDGAES